MKRVILVILTITLLSLVSALPVLAAPNPDVLTRAFSHSTEAATMVKQIIESRTGKKVELRVIEIEIHGQIYHVDPIYIWCD